MTDPTPRTAPKPYPIWIHLFAVGVWVYSVIIMVVCYRIDHFETSTLQIVTWFYGMALPVSQGILSAIIMSERSGPGG
jgi:hypothetical protein